MTLFLCEVPQVRSTNTPAAAPSLALDVRGYMYTLQFTIFSTINYQCTTVYLEFTVTEEGRDMWSILVWFQQVTITWITPLMLHK